MTARTRSTIISALLLTGLSIVLVTAWLVTQGRLMRREAEAKAMLSTRLLVEASRGLLVEGDVLRLARMADRAASSEEITRIMLTDRNGWVIVDTQRKAYYTLSGAARLAMTGGGVRLVFGKDLWTAVAPVRDDLGRVAGAAIVTFSTHRLHAAEHASQRAGMLIALIGIGVGIVLTFLATRYQLQPLTDLVRAIRRVEAGQLSSPVPVSGPTEFIEIGHAFNSMVDAVRQRIHNLELLNEMEASLARAADMPATVGVLKRSSEALLGADLYVWVQDPPLRSLIQVCAADEEPTVERVWMDSGCPVIQSFQQLRMISIGEGADLPPGTEIVEGLAVSAGLILALWTPEGTVGVLAFVGHGDRLISTEDRSLAWAMAALAAPMMAAAVRTQTQARAVAALQALLIPRTPPNIGADVHALYLPAEEATGLGGDYYDFDDLGDSNWGIVMGDASGHGLDAARYATMAKWILRSFIHEYEDPADVLRQSNGILAVQEMAEGFITLFYCIWDPQKSRVRYSNAGHPPGLLYRASSGEVDELASSGTALGVTPDAAYDTLDVSLASGDVLCLYTDGITEARQNSQWFGMERLLASLKAHAGGTSSEIAEAITEEVKAFAEGATRDDIAILVLKAT